MLEHIVLFDYSKNIKDIEKEKYFKCLLESVKLLEEIPGIISIHFCKNITQESDLVFRVIFKNKNDLKTFQMHPLHEIHKERIKSIVSNRRVIDFEF